MRISFSVSIHKRLRQSQCAGIPLFEPIHDETTTDNGTGKENRINRIPEAAIDAEPDRGRERKQVENNQRQKKSIHTLPPAAHDHCRDTDKEKCAYPHPECAPEKCRRESPSRMRDRLAKSHDRPLGHERIRRRKKHLVAWQDIPTLQVVCPGIMREKSDRDACENLYGRHWVRKHNADSFFEHRRSV